MSKAQTAPAADLAKAFGPDSKREEIIQEILRKGEVQVNERERKELLERVEKEVLELVSSRLVDPTTKRVYTTGMIGKALDQLSAASGQQQQQHGGGKQPQQQQQLHQQLQQLQLQQKAAAAAGGGAASSSGPASGADTPESSASAYEESSVSTSQAGTPAQLHVLDEKTGKRKPHWTGVVANKSAKIQALDAMKALIAWQPVPVMRARMRLRITCPTAALKQTVRSSALELSSAGPAIQESSNNASPAPSKGKGKGKGKNKKGKKHAADESDAEDEPGQSGQPGQPPAAAGTVKDRILSYVEQVESQEVLGGEEWEVVGFAEPGAFKGLSEFIGSETKGRGRVEVLDMAVTHEE